MSEEPDLFSLEQGRAGREAGKDLVEAHGEGFVELMRREAERIFWLRGVVNCDDLRAYAKSLGIVPNHPNTWGSIFRGPHWKQIGLTQSQLVSNHARTIREWKYLP